MVKFDDQTKGKLLVLFKLAFLTVLAIAIPRFFIKCDKTKSSSSCSNESVEFGLDGFLSDKSLVQLAKKLSVGFVCDDAAYGRSVVDRLKSGGIHVKKVFLISNDDDEYLNSFDTCESSVVFVGNKTIPQFCDFCRGLQVLLLDIQGLGLRCDGTLALLRQVIAVSKELDLRLLVLDTPNPLGGKVEGPGIIPLRHGLTVGELAHYLNNSEFGGGVAITVSPVKGWSRCEFANIPCRGCRNIVQEASVLSFLAPFFYIKPFSDLIKKYHNQHTLDTVFFLATTSCTLSAWEMSYLCDMLSVNGISCSKYKCENDGIFNGLSGIKIDSVNNFDSFNSFGTFLKTMKFFCNRRMLEPRYMDNFDHEIGSPTVRKALEGYVSFGDLLVEMESAQNDFCLNIKDYLLYYPAPYVIPIGSVKVSRVV